MSEERNRPVLDRRGLAKNRIEALADGIFAVAMTLLVLDIKSPQNLSLETTGELIGYLLALEHNFAMYAISFLVLAIFWIAHHVLFHFVRHVDRRLLWLNVAFLLLVTFVPFSTDLLGDHGHLPLPVVVYGVNLIALGGLLDVQLRYLRALSGARLARSHARSWRRACTVSSRCTRSSRSRRWRPRCSARGSACISTCCS